MRGIPEDRAWSYGTVETLWTLPRSLEIDNQVLFSGQSPRGMLGIELQSEDDPLIVSENAEDTGSQHWAIWVFYFIKTETTKSNLLIFTEFFPKTLPVLISTNDHKTLWSEYYYSHSKKRKWKPRKGEPHPQAGKGLSQAPNPRALIQGP